MKQTPIHSNFNPALLKAIPDTCSRVVEVGCSSGALAKAYSKKNPGCVYTGIEIDPDYADVARQFCNEVICANVEDLAEEEFLRLFPSDCWVFGDTLEHLYDPWSLLRRIKPRLSTNGQIIACVPNAQHWSIQVNLSCGFFRYANEGLMDRTHIRWFTRKTLIDLFESTGYKITEGFPRIFDEPIREKFLPTIRALAVAGGANPDEAISDAIPLQWVVKAVPV